MLSVVSRFVRCTAVSLMGSSLLLLSPSQSLAQSSSPVPLSDSANPTGATLPLVSSASQIDYSPLQAELEAGDFYDANETTRRLLYEAAGREDQGWLTPESIKAIPCQDLKIMDSLWRRYSNNRFGFSVQYNIFQQTGNRPGILRSTDAYEAFGEAIGWRHDSPEGEGREWIFFKQALDYSVEAPAGHLPNLRSEYQLYGGRVDYTYLMERLRSCQGGAQSQ